jgi:transcriptional regulator with XRE-family HTH domain
MPNFFEQQRNKLGLSGRAMAARLGIANQTVNNWENDKVVPAEPIAALAKSYEVSESRMEREVMAQRRRIEAKALATAK